MSAAPPFWPIEASRAALDDISEVLPNKLFMTNHVGAANTVSLRSMGITHIMAVGSEFLDTDESGFTFWKKDITDDAYQRDRMADALRDAVAFQKNAIAGGGKVLVHCAAGISRSATVVLAYLLLHVSSSLLEAFNLLMSRRRIVWPNDGFMTALIALELEEHGNASMTIEEYVSWGEYEPATESAVLSMERTASSINAADRLKRAESSTFEALASSSRRSE